MRALADGLQALVLLFVLILVVAVLHRPRRPSEHFKLQSMTVPTTFLQGLYDGLIIEEGWDPHWPSDAHRKAAGLTGFASNHYSYKCCPSEPRNGEGCACLTSEQRWLLRNRGGNGI
jgi:hypothetical protein